MKTSFHLDYCLYLSSTEQGLEINDCGQRTMGKTYSSYSTLPATLRLCLAGPLWRFSTGSSDADRHQSLVGAWWSGLSQKEESCSHPDKVMLASCYYPLNRQGKKHSYPATISARQRPITTRQRANSKRT